MNAMSLPGLDAHLTADPFPRRRFRSEDEAREEITREIRTDRDRMLALLDENAADQDDDEALAEFRNLILLLAAPESDTRAADELATCRRQYRALLKDLADKEAQHVIDNGDL
jgi:hypothetical protein